MGSGRVEFPEEAWTGIFAEYRGAIASGSEAPPEFHWASLFPVIGSIVARRAWMPYGLPVCLNSFVLLLGGTGSKKSSAVTMAARLGRKAGTDVSQIWGVSTGEGLLEVLSKAPGVQALIVENELRSLLSKGQSKGATLFSVLCQLFDSPPRVDLLTRANPIVAEHPHVSILSASTAEGIEDLVGSVEVFGGLFNRFMFFSGAPSEPNPWPTIPDEGAWAGLLSTLQDIRDDYASVTRIEFRGATVRRAWEEFYRADHKRQQAQPEILAALTNRQHVHVAKLSLLFAVIRGGREIEVDDLERAIAVGRYLLAVVESVVEPLGQNPASQLEGRIEKFLSERAMTRRELHQRLSGRVKSRDLSQSLDTLCDLERIEEMEGGLLAWTDADYFTRFRAEAV